MFLVPINYVQAIINIERKPNKLEEKRGMIHLEEFLKNTPLEKKTFIIVVDGTIKKSYESRYKNFKFYTERDINQLLKELNQII